MTESGRMQIKGALRKCAKENEGKTTYTGYVVISSVCNAAAERIEELEETLEKVKQGKIKWVDYDAGEDSYEDSHVGHWEVVNDEEEKAADA